MKSIIRYLALASILLTTQHTFAAMLIGQFQAVDANQGRSDFVKFKYSTTGCATYKTEPPAAPGLYTYTVNLYSDQTFTITTTYAGGMPSLFINGDWAPLNAQQTQFRLIPSGTFSGATGTASWDTFNTMLSQTTCQDESYSGVNYITAKYPASIKIQNNTLTRASTMPSALGYAGSLHFSFEESVKTFKFDNAAHTSGNYPKAKLDITMKGYWITFTPPT